MAKVSLDALIDREDFEIAESLNPGKKKDSISIEDLKSDSFFISSLRKPDFQRETNEWDSEKICQFIESFVHGDLIPAIILWRSNLSGVIFVIDGAHRLSALISWMNDDYGDGIITKQLFDGIVPEEQLQIAEDARKLIRKRIGTYSDYKLALTNPDKVQQFIIPLAKNLGALAIQLQWVEGDINSAEKSFLKINQQAAPIDPVELKLLESRKKPNCIAARAIIKSGKGHKYWSKFSPETQLQIQEIAKEINDILFTPKLKNPIKTLDLPIGGKQYSSQTLPLVLDFINMTNNVSNDFKNTVDDDADGTKTVIYLKNTKKIAYRINSIHESSLGLHPIIYFYSHEGRFKTSSFYSIIEFVLQLDKRKSFDLFIKNREKFEKAIYQYDYVIQQIFRKHRSAYSSAKHISNFYFKLLESLNLGKEIDESIKEIANEEDFKYLSFSQDEEEVTTADFSRERKSAIYIKEVIDSAPKCNICKGLIHMNSITFDHIQRKQDGGRGNVNNGQIAHPYCNSTYKN